MAKVHLSSGLSLLILWILLWILALSADWCRLPLCSTQWSHCRGIMENEVEGPDPK